MTREQKRTSVQDSTKNVQRDSKSSRSRAQRMGKFRWLNYRMDRVERRQRTIIRMLRVVINSFEPFIQIDSVELQRVVCSDEVDEAILEHLRVRGRKATTPNEACESKILEFYGLKPYQVTRRIQAMNRRLRKWLGKEVAVNLHRRWQLSRFVKKTFGDIEEES